MYMLVRTRAAKRAAMRVDMRIDVSMCKGVITDAHGLTNVILNMLYLTCYT